MIATADAADPSKAVAFRQQTQHVDVQIGAAVHANQKDAVSHLRKRGSNIVVAQLKYSKFIYGCVRDKCDKT